MYSQCSGCPREHSEHITTTPYKADIMIIGDIPTAFEIIQDELFCDTASKTLYRELYDVGIDMSQCYITKAIKCNLHNEKPNRKAVKLCREILHEEVRAVQPKYILTLGAFSLDALLGVSGLLKNHGKTYNFEGAVVIPTYNPSAMVTQPHLAIEFRADIAYFAQTMFGKKSTPKDFKYKIVQSHEMLEEVCEVLSKEAVIAYDIECTGLDPYATGAKLFMLGIATDKGVYIIPLETEHYTNPGVPVSEYYEKIAEILKKNNISKVAHYGKFDNRWLRDRGIEPYIDFDTYLGAYLLNVNTPHGLKWLAKTYCGADDYDAGIVFKDGLSLKEFDAMAKYCALDCYYTLKLYYIIRDEIKGDRGLANVFRYIIMQGERVLQKIEHNGVYVDSGQMELVTRRYKADKSVMEDEIRELLPDDMKDMNLNSTKQLATLFFEKLKLPIISVTPSGTPSTGKSTLLRLTDYSPLPEMLLRYKKLEKALNGFLVPWVDYLKRDGRLHTTYNIAKTATGRLSAEDPNLQQVPRDANVRQLISAPPGTKFIEADYSQIELRVGAFVAGENVMKEAYRNEQDIHAITASQVAGIPLADVTKTQRTGAKAVNFGFLYGMGAKGFKSYAFDTYGALFTEQGSVDARNKYFTTYPALLPWHERQRREVNTLGYVKTATGRIRHLPNVYSPDREIRSGAERQAINTPVQSFASDITMLAMIVIDGKLEKLYKDKAFLVGQVHDAIMVQADDDVATEVAILVKKCMESVPLILEKYFGVSLDIPLVAEVELGQSWGTGKIVEIPTV